MTTATPEDQMDQHDEIESMTRARVMPESVVDEGLRVQIERLMGLQEQAQETFFRLASIIAPILRPGALAVQDSAVPEQDGQPSEMTTLIIECQRRQDSLVMSMREVFERVNL